MYKSVLESLIDRIRIYFDIRIEDVIKDISLNKSNILSHYYDINIKCQMYITEKFIELLCYDCNKQIIIKYNIFDIIMVIKKI